MKFFDAVIKVFQSPFYMGMIVITLLIGLINLISPMSRMWYFYTIPFWITLWALLEMINDKNGN